MSQPDRLEGPRTAVPADVDRINRVFSDAFTDRYQRDGMSGVRVPMLNPAIWRFAIAAAGDGALVWHDRGELVAFNLVHQSGAEGWMGPLAVKPSRQGEGIGALIVRTAVNRLEAGGAKVIGLETMPRTVDNIGFYSRLGFRPEHLTVSMARDIPSPPSNRGALLLSAEGDGRLRDCQSLLDALCPGVDFTREVALTLERSLGDATLILERGQLAAFALWHAAPLAEGRSADEIRVLKLAARNLAAFQRLLIALEAAAWSALARRVAIRCQTAYRNGYAALLEAGYRVHWTDLRMTFEGKAESPAREGGILFSNWEI